MDDNQTAVAKVKPRRLPSDCRICGIPALYAYYGTIACHSCKVFFKRNVSPTKKSLRCQFDGQCLVNELTRHVCAACRLSKCLLVGMQIELIRGSRSNKSTSSSQIAKLTTLNLVETDLSLLHEDQWIVLRNLNNSYDQSIVCSFAETIKKASLQSNTRSPAAVQDLVASFYETAGVYLRLNSDIQKVAYDDRSILLHTAADNTTCLGSVFLFNYTQLYDDELLWQRLQFMYGETPAAYHRWAGQMSLPDVVLFKFALALFSLSTNSRVLHPSIVTEYADPLAILAIENQYVELIWRYLVHKYRHEQAVRIFLKLTEWFLALTLFMSHAHNSELHVEDINSLIERVEVSLILDDVDRMV